MQSGLPALQFSQIPGGGRTTARQLTGCMSVGELLTCTQGLPLSTDRIEKKVLLRSPLKRVWRAIADSNEFGNWFGLKFDGPFVQGASLRGVIVPSTVNPEINAVETPHEGVVFDITIEKIEPERLFSFRWHPHAVKRDVDYSAEPTTLVVFTLEEVADGVMLTITESGFHRIPLARRAEAFLANDAGWSMMVRAIGDYLGKAA